MKVFTCINATMVDAAVVWAHSLQKVAKMGKETIEPYIFHTPDVDPHRFSDLGVSTVNIGFGPELSGKYSRVIMEGMTMRLRVLDMMMEREFSDTVIYTDADVLFQRPLDELAGCPMTENVWIAARNDNVFFDCKRNGKFYKDYDTYHDHKKQFSDTYFNSGILIIHLKGLQKAVARKKFDSLMDYYMANRESYIFPDQDCLNSLVTEYNLLFDRYNAFAELGMRMDFGDILARRDALSAAHIVHYCGTHKPWSQVPDGSLPTLHGTQYPFEDYLAACEEIITYLTPAFVKAVRGNVKANSLMIQWQQQVRGVAGPLKVRLTEAKEKFDNEL